jgi:hypothetical protein
VLHVLPGSLEKSIKHAKFPGHTSLYDFVSRAIIHYCDRSRAPSLEAVEDRRRVHRKVSGYRVKDNRTSNR